MSRNLFFLVDMLKNGGLKADDRERFERRGSNGDHDNSN